MKHSQSLTERIMKHLLAILFEAILLIICGGVWADEAFPEAQPQVLVCPQSLNLCKWDSQTGWSPYWDTSVPEIIQDFRQTSFGDTIVLLRGHQDPGRLVIIQRNGQPILTRNIHPDGALGLPALTGEDPSGSVILCGGGPGSFYCDTWLLRGGRKPVPMGTSFPTNCIFPRFSTSGTFACVETWPRPRIRVQASDGVGYDDIDLPDVGRSVDDFQILTGNRFLLAANRKILLWEDGVLRQLSTDPYFEIVRGSEGFYFSGYREGSDPMDFYIAFYAADGSGRTIWESDDLVPRAILPLGSGLLLDLENEHIRKLVYLQLKEGAFSESALWQGHSLTTENQNR